MLKKLKLSIYLVITIFLTLGLSISFQSLLAAWTPPTTNPAGSNVKMPIYNSSPDPLKSAINTELTVNGDFYVSDVLWVDDTTKQLGINTIPEAYLHIKNDELTDGKVGLILEDEDEGVWAEYRPGNSATDWQAGANTYGFSIVDKSSDEYRLIIDNSGNVVIGDTGSNEGLKLDVEGKVGATEYCDNNGSNCKAASSLLTSESDPKIGGIAEGKWCRGVGGKIVCDRDEPSAPPPTSCPAMTMTWSSHCCGPIGSASVGGSVNAISDPASGLPCAGMHGTATYSCTTSGWQRTSCQCNGSPC